MQLPYDLRAVEGTLLFHAGEAITPRRLKALTKTPAPIRMMRIGETSLFADLQRVFQDKRYATILSPEQINRDIIRHVRAVSLPEPIIKELRRIKRLIPYTYRHILRTAVLSTKLCLDAHNRRTYDPGFMARLSLVHDLGKSRIPVEILDKETPLTATEFAILKTHPLIGYILLHYYCGKDHHQYDFASYEHHERLDGSGYPRHLRKIEKYSQVIAVVDVLDALISSRPYRKEPYTMRAALDHLLDEADAGKLNRAMVLLLIAQARKTKPSPRTLRISREKRDAPPRENMYGKFLQGTPDSLTQKSAHA